MEQKAQPPPVPWQPQEPRMENPREPEVSRIKGWLRMMVRYDKHELYWKGRNDVAILVAHTLNAKDAESMMREINTILRKYDQRPFNPESANVQHSEIANHQQTQDGSQGSLESSTGS